ncbi:MAG: DUF502 domain-containing protein [Planctomycetaceae bacterium]|jgi:uncharacterized membrane protein|nr:MAG: DUF502 domain-containing protein [Planctomycetaceae bacterium]
MAKDASPRFIRRTFLTGLLILIPLFVTYALIAFLFNIFTNASAPLMSGLFRFLDLNRYGWTEPLVPLINFLLSLAVIFLLGLFGANFLGRRILQAVDALILRLPLVKSIYGAVKQLVDTFQGPRRGFQRVVLIQYPSRGLWTMGFVSSERPDTMKLTPSPTILTVYIPTTPNPTTGYLVMMRPEEVVDVDYTVEEAFKFIISSGIVGRELTSPGSVLPGSSPTVVRMPVS